MDRWPPSKFYSFVIFQIKLHFNLQVPKGVVQTGAKAFTKAAKKTKIRKTSLVDQMKERIQIKGLILPYEKM